MSNADEAAFPIVSTESVRYEPGWDVKSSGGLTKREYFAAKAMQALGTPHYSEKTDHMESLEPETVAKCAILIADALLKELSK